ncbi:MAG: ABC transporter ATP-binding protein [Desulfomonile tiedjei]|nr:ABC transporter ATP-binding protein [Desulfomonile tiedjei]
MKDWVIRAEGLGKQYEIGATQARHSTLRESLTAAFTGPFRRLMTSGNRLDNNDRVETIWALKDVSFEVKEGEVLGVIGRNGAGKSTLLKILSRITEPTEGYAEIRGRVGSLLEVGTGFHSELTGRENIYLNGAVLGMKKEEIGGKFDEIVSFAEVNKFIDTPVKHYSSGMYLRLAFAVAAHLEPEILLVDEVLAVGDAAFQKKCLGKMDDVAKEGRTVVFVSHNLASLQSLCTKGILLESGKVSMDGAIGAVMHKYLDSGKEQNGEVSWASPDIAPGDDRVRLKAVRVVIEGAVTGEVDISKEFQIEVDYWNLEPDSRRLVSIHLYTSMGVCVLTSGNVPSACLIPDPWYSRHYPSGLFRTSCAIPGFLLNDDIHSISLYINEMTANDNIIIMRDILTFTVQDTGAMRKEYTGKWIGAVRPRLHWQTTQLNAPDE